MIRFVYNMIQSDKNNARAESINIKAFNREESAKAKVKEKEKQVNDSVEKLANRKRAILITSMKDFLDTYEKIKKINFTDGEGIKELMNSQFSLTEYVETEKMVNVASVKMTTGQTIAAMIIKGGVSGVISKESEINLNLANIRKKQSYVVESQMESVYTLLDYLYQRCERMTDILTKLNMLFIKSIKATKLLIEERGLNKSNYTRDDKEKLMNCINFASVIKQILDAKILDSNGDITQQSMEVINMGNEYLQKIQNVINR